MKTVYKICLWVLCPVAAIIGLFLLLIGWFYITCPVYHFEEPQPFSGTVFYNPYQAITADGWKKCVFHLHTKKWMGLTNGKNSYEEMIDAYRQLNYDVITVSDYMYVDRKKSDNQLFIPVYEHGYNVKKTHQLALGANKVVWRDYFFPQNLNQKQHVIDLLKKHSLLVAVNHPSMRSGYRPDDFKYLSGYDLFEVQNGTHLSETAWDAALSSGHPAWLIANDDAHSIHPACLQREVTFVNTGLPVDNALTSPNNQPPPVTTALTSPNNRPSPVTTALISPNNRPSPEITDLLNRLSVGVAFGVHFPDNQQATMEDKIREAATVSFPVSIQVRQDTLFVVWQQMMQQIDFIGDNGSLLKMVTESDAAYYPIRPKDTYVRIKLTSPERLVYYLNPIIRCQDDYPVKPPLSRIDRVHLVYTFVHLNCFR